MQENNPNEPALAGSYSLVLIGTTLAPFIISGQR
jgi:hypothetical protein